MKVNIGHWSMVVDSAGYRLRMINASKWLMVGDGLITKHTSCFSAGGFLALNILMLPELPLGFPGFPGPCLLRRPFRQKSALSKTSFCPGEVKEKTMSRWRDSLRKTTTTCWDWRCGTRLEINVKWYVCVSVLDYCLWTSIYKLPKQTEWYLLESSLTFT